MIRLTIIFFLMSMVERQNCTFSVHQLNELKQIFYDAERRMERATQGQSKNALIVIGHGKAGKSTLINYLIENALEAYRPYKFGSMKIRLTDENIAAPIIFAGPLSGTTIPSKWNSRRSELQNLDIWDSAGFSDNRQNMEDLSNAFYLYHLTRNVENLKLSLVISYDDIITDNVENMRKLLRVLEKFLADRFRSFYPSISVIISKAPEHIKESSDRLIVDIKYITDTLQRNLLSSSDMSLSKVSKDFVEYIINNTEKLAIFRIAKHNGNLTSTINVNIFPAINNCNTIIKSNHQDIGIPMSDMSENCLHSSTDALLPIDELTDLETKLFNLFDEKFPAPYLSSDINTLQTNKAKLNTIDQRFNTEFTSNSEAVAKLTFLKTISDDFKDIIESNDVLTKIKLTIFTDFILKQNKMKNVDTLVKVIIDSIQVKVKSYLTSCSRRLNEITEAEYRRRQDEDATNRKIIVNTTQNNISKLPKTENKKSGWRIFMEKLATFLDLDGDGMTMG